MYLCSQQLWGALAARPHVTLRLNDSNDRVQNVPLNGELARVVEEASALLHRMLLVLYPSVTLSCRVVSKNPIRVAHWNSTLCRQLSSACQQSIVLSEQHAL